MRTRAAFMRTVPQGMATASHPTLLTLFDSRSVSSQNRIDRGGSLRVFGHTCAGGDQRFESGGVIAVTIIEVQRAPDVSTASPP